LEDERAWFLHVYLRVGRNPYEVCLHSSLKLPGGDTLLDVHPTQRQVLGVGWEKRSVISNHFTELDLEIMEMSMFPVEINATKNDIIRQRTTFLGNILTTDRLYRKFFMSGFIKDRKGGVHVIQGKGGFCYLNSICGQISI